MRLRELAQQQKEHGEEKRLICRPLFLPCCAGLGFIGDGRQAPRCRRKISGTVPYAHIVQLTVGNTHLTVNPSDITWLRISSSNICNLADSV